jgi:cell division protein FtsW
MFLVIALNTNLIGGNRVHTWMSRIETFTSSKKTADVEDESIKAKNYQVMQAKAAIVHGGFNGIGPGKSALKQTSTIGFRFYFRHYCRRIWLDWSLCSD